MKKGKSKRTITRQDSIVSIDDHELETLTNPSRRSNGLEAAALEFDFDPEEAHEYTKIALLIGNYVVQIVISLILIAFCIFMIIREGPDAVSSNVFFAILGGVTEFWLQKTLEYGGKKSGSQNMIRRGKVLLNEESIRNLKRYFHDRATIP